MTISAQAMEGAPLANTDQGSRNECIPLVVTLPQLAEFLKSNASDPLDPFSLDHLRVRAGFDDIKARAKAYVASDRSKAVQTDSSMEDRASSNQLKPPRGTRRLQSADFQTDYLQNLSTPPDTPPAILTSRRSEVDELPPLPPSPPRAAILDLGNTSQASTTGTARRRIPWTLSESIKLWHGAHGVDRPSWANIWQRYFRSSRRTPVDLKDRWRVISRNVELQEHLRRVYEQWLVSANTTSVDTGPT
ncbi:hypothetical protein AAHC03_013694 [Spirometra sp. Aus1]